MKTKRRYVYLFCGLLVYLVLGAFLSSGVDDSRFVSRLLLPLCAGFGVVSLVGTRWFTLTGSALVSVALVLEVVDGVYGPPLPGHLATLSLLIFCVLCIVAVLRDVLFGGMVDLNRLFGAGAVYLLLGVTWALLYALMDAVPGESVFRGIDDAVHMHPYTYFSFVTLTTLGFGDIVPVSPLARTLVTMEAVVGQLYLAVLIAGLVGRLRGP